MFAGVAARLDAIFLIFAVHTFFHALEQQAGLVALKQFIPFTAPDDLDDIPACAPEKPFQFLDDLSIAAYRSVQPLQVAVNDPDQIIEAFARAKRDGAERLRFVAFTVANKAPNFCLFAADEAARFQVTVKTRLI